MPAAQISEKIRDALNDIKSTNLDDPRLDEILKLAENLTSAMQLLFSSMDRSVHGEFSYISDYIKRTRKEIATLQPNDLRDEQIPQADQELEAVVRDTETATETIMHEAESLMEVVPEDLESYQATVIDAMMRMIEACSFQDITGQRVRKVVDTIAHIEERISRFADVMGVADVETEKSDKQAWREANLLNGPGLNGPVVSQEAIDKMFD